MTHEVLTIAKDLSVWALAIIAVYFVAEAVLRGDATSTRVWYVKVGAGLMFGVFLLVLAVSSALLPRVGWAPMKQLYIGMSKRGFLVHI